MPKWDGKENRGQWAMRAMTMEPKLHQYLAQNTNFAQASEKELESVGFFPCCDCRAVPGHKYYEGYFHALSTSEPVESINPRYGSPYQKPAAPIALRAFVIAYFRKNQKWLDAATKGTPLEFFTNNEKVIADLAAQIHFGDAIENEFIGWHMDNINSIVHFSISLKGTRALHFVHTNLANKEVITEADLQDDHKDRAHKWQKEGDLYISSPYAFLHAVEYPKCAWDDRIIAVQCRVLMNTEEMKNLYDTAEDLKSTMEKITSVMKDAPVEVPRMDEVLEVERELKSKQTQKQNEPSSHNKCIIC